MSSSRGRAMARLALLALLLAAFTATVSTPVAAQAEAGTLQVFMHGDTPVFDVGLPAGQGETWMDTTAVPGDPAPKLVISHSDGFGLTSLPAVFTLKDPLAQGLNLGDGNPATDGVDTDFVDIHYCMGEVNNAAFVPRVVLEVYVDSTLVGRRLSNDLALPTQAPQCVDGKVALNHDLDDQTPADTPLGVATTANGDILAPAGSRLQVRIAPNTPFAAIWYFAYDATDFAAGATFHYSLVGGATNSTGGGDSDNDGLNDTCEQQYFGNLTAANSSADPDGDGLNNAQECAGGTDPTKADSDGDGVNDKDDPFPTDPARGGSNTTTSTSNTTSTSKTNSTTNTTTSQSSTTTSSNATTSDAGSIESLDDAIEALKSDLGYLGGSAGGLLAVLVLCILGLAVRWSL